MKLRYSFAKQHGLLVHEHDDDHYEIIHKKNITLTSLIELQRNLQTEFTLTEVSDEQFQQSLTQYYQKDNNTAYNVAQNIEEELDLDELKNNLPRTEDLLESEDEAPVIRLLNALFSQAVKQKASDIHLETFENKMVVRYRIDGILQEVLVVQRVLAPLIISRIKVMAKLDIAEKRIPQDGRISLRIAGHTIDIRVSTMPSNHGERTVMRLLDQQNAHLDLSTLGIQHHLLEQIKRLLEQPHGILLVTGPTGSGKTTSLYGMLSRLNKSSRNILTIEDPIEYDLPGIGQTQVNNKVNMTFAKGLRAILRQDPDVVMVGEIRDVETAEIAVQASLTGHLVLSTLHTNSAIGAIARLRDMGVPSFLLSSSIIGLLAQRLVRQLCQTCKLPTEATPAEATLLMLDIKSSHTIYQAQGCNKCHQSGYLGRLGIYELVIINEQMRELIHQNQGEQVLEQFARKSMPSIRQNGINHVLAGNTTLAEILRVTNT